MLKLDSHYHLALTVAMLTCSSCSAEAPSELAALVQQSHQLTQTNPSGEPILNTQIANALTSEEAFKLMDLEGVESLAQGICGQQTQMDKKHSCIVIYVSNNNIEFQSSLPKQLSGIPVRIEVSDAISIFEAP
jgi:hypothetical protein